MGEMTASPCLTVFDMRARDDRGRNRGWDEPVVCIRHPHNLGEREDGRRDADGALLCQPRVGRVFGKSQHGRCEVDEFDDVGGISPTAAVVLHDH